MLGWYSPRKLAGNPGSAAVTNISILYFCFRKLYVHIIHTDFLSAVLTAIYRLTCTNCYRLQMKLRKGNVFTSVCQEFCPQGEVYTPSVSSADTPLWADTPLSRHRPEQTPPEQTPPGQTPPPGRHPPADTPLGRHPSPADGYCSGLLLECILVSYVINRQC